MIKKNTTGYLIIANLAIFIFMFIFGGFNAFNDPKIYYLFGAQTGSWITYQNQWFRLITSMFVHGGLFHILFNLYALYWLGNQIETIYGKYKFFIVYIASGLVGNLFTNLLTPGAISVGASGAIFGLLGLLLGSTFRHDSPTWHRQSMLNSILPILAINLLLGFTMSSINIIAHIGGTAAGFTFGWLMPIHSKTMKEFKIYKYIYFGIIGITALSFGLLILNDIINFF